MPEEFFTWSSWVFGVVGALGAFGLWKWRKKPKAHSKTKIVVKNSAGADVVGRDRGAGGRKADTHETDIDLSDSNGAKATGRDDRED